MNKKIFASLLIVLLSSHCLAMETNINSVTSENGRLKRQLELQLKSIWTQHGTKLALYTGLIFTAAFIHSHLPEFNGSCEKEMIKECLTRAQQKSTIVTTMSLAGIFLLIELIYIFTTICITKMI